MNLDGGGASKFFLNGIWSSLSQVPVMDDATYLKAGETKTFQVRLAVPLYFGAVSERFYLTDTLGKKYPNSDFTVSLTINHPPQRVVEIVNTLQLNVHSNPLYSASTTNRVTLGQRFIVLQDNKEGWLQLDLGGGKVGWIVTMYTKTV
jgi:uncharacterized protein YgiM (DUF1202 family)